ncbi:MAG: gliding motility-associated ABC transporter substrate-binding protein GldG [Prevotellaceae bacterium]|jgi:gliding-associated putative ABC transporter substrate-binding component GldG|nr:gliding motility-associated ABC transporter substrate-binding protein GldG [Prevotellaceae bacterium]
MSLKKKNILSFLLLLSALFLLNSLVSLLNLRIDLTEDRRYTIAEPSKKIIKNLDDIIFVRIYLDGEMPVKMKKLRTSVREKLDELKQYPGGKNIQYEFRNPSEGTDEKRDAVYRDLAGKGLSPLTIFENDLEGGASQRLIFPGALVNYKGKELAVNFIQQNQMSATDEANLNFALQNLEYELINAIQKISRTSKDKIAFVEGHGELDDYSLDGIFMHLSSYYDVERLSIDAIPGILDEYKAVVIAKPMERWLEADKFVLDQYIMNGGRTAWFVDAVHVHEDSLSRGIMTMGFVCEHNLNDQLFNYGVRINHNVLQDLQCARIQIRLTTPDMSGGFRLVPWTYFPLLWTPSDNPITKGVNLVKAQYPGVIDTVGNNPEIKKTYLLYSSDKAKVSNAPMVISLSQIEEKITQRVFNQSYLPVAVLLEGEFVSPFRNRLISQYVNDSQFAFKSKSQKTKMIVVSDGDIIRNEVRRSGINIEPLPLGFDRNTNNTYGNKDFVMNIINYLTDENSLMDVKNRTFKMRLLDNSKVAKNHNKIVAINTVLPVVVVIVCGIIFLWYRRRKYS